MEPDQWPLIATTLRPHPMLQGYGKTTFPGPREGLLPVHCLAVKEMRIDKSHRGIRLGGARERAYRTKARNSIVDRRPLTRFIWLPRER